MVTANAEQMPSTKTEIGFIDIGVEKALNALDFLMLLIITLPDSFRRNRCENAS